MEYRNKEHETENIFPQTEDEEQSLRICIGLIR